MWISHIRDVWKLAACMLGSVVYKRVSNVFCTIRVRLRNSQCLLRSGREIGKAALPLQVATEGLFSPLRFVVRTPR